MTGFTKAASDTVAKDVHLGSHEPTTRATFEHRCPILPQAPWSTNETGFAPGTRVTELPRKTRPCGGEGYPRR